MKPAQELINLLPPKTRVAFLSEVQNQNPSGYLEGKKYYNVEEMVNRCLTWSDTKQGADFLVKVCNLNLGR